jgi:CDP-diacylglycerol--glycerol-3-phosphate 3-phosphatidyltransferase
MILFFLKNFDNSKLFNIADYFSLYRIFVTPFLLIFLFFNLEIIFGILLIISFLTDAIDGFLARKLKIVTERGAYIDSLGNVITLSVSLVGLFYFHWQFLIEQKFIIIPLVLIYFGQLVLTYIRYGKPSSFHTYSAKISGVIAAIFFVSIFLFDVWYPLFYLTAIIALIEEIEEVILIFVLPVWQTDVRGLYWVLQYKLSNKI